jgi:peptidoglycan-associated lipoprotein
MFTRLAKMFYVLLAVVVIAGCSSSSTSGGGESGGSASGGSSGAQSSGHQGSDISGGDYAATSAGNIVYFDFDQAAIRPDARAVLMAHAQRLKKGGRATLEGHADERGTREYNMALGERRGKAVRDFLVLQGVSRSQLEVVSFGEERPADRASNELAWAKNRRVEIR